MYTDYVCSINSLAFTPVFDLQKKQKKKTLQVGRFDLAPKKTVIFFFISS